jgi:hypothetical protein
VTVSVEPLMVALVTEVLTKSMGSPTCQSVIVPVRPDGLSVSVAFDRLAHPEPIEIFPRRRQDAFADGFPRVAHLVDEKHVIAPARQRECCCAAGRTTADQQNVRLS